ncbi:hypothetical protein BCO19218_05888 [Burkholderia contaminans]|nr:hypothetical protein BCO19218_05888 [Burkholderia contaminans]
MHFMTHAQTGLHTDSNKPKVTPSSNPKWRDATQGPSAVTQAGPGPLKIIRRLPPTHMAVIVPR